MAMAAFKKNPPSSRRGKARRKKKTDARDKGYEGTNFDLSSEDDVGGDKEPLTSVKDFKDQLKKLNETDPEFYQYLQENDQKLLEFKSDTEEEESEEEEEEERLEFEEEEEDGENESNEEHDQESDAREVVTVTNELIAKWKDELKRSRSIGSLTELTAALHCAIISIVTSGEERKDKDTPLIVQNKNYVVHEGEVFNSLVLSCLQYVCQTLEHHLSSQPLSSNRFSLPSTHKKWSRLRLAIKSYLIDVLQLLTGITDSGMVCALLRHIEGLWIYYCCFPKLSRHLSKLLVKTWSQGNSEDGATVLSFLILRKIYTTMNSRKQEDLLKSLYLSYIRNSRYTTVSSLPHIRFMCGCLVEFLSLSPDHAHQLVFVYTRQLANQLRSAFSNNAVAVATWPFMHSLELFSGVLSSPRCDKSLFPLIYPVTMVAMGVAQFLLSSSAAFVPMRLHIVRILLEVATETNTYIPLAPILLEILESYSSGKSVRGGGGGGGGGAKPPSLLCTLKLKKNQMNSKATQTAVLNWSMELLIKLLTSCSHLISFPEMSFPTIIRLRKIVKMSSISWLKHHLKQIIEKTEETSRLMMKERSDVTFSPKDKEEVESWERAKKTESNPLKSFHETWQVIQRQLEETEREKGEEEDEEESDDDGSNVRKKKKKMEGKDGLSRKKRKTSKKEEEEEDQEEEDDRVEEFELSSNEEDD